MMTQKLLSLLVLLMTAATSAVAEEGLTISLEPANLELKVGETKTVKCIITGNFEGRVDPEWSHSSESCINFALSNIARTVLVTGKAPGTATIRCTARDKTAYCNVTVTPDGYCGDPTVNEGKDVWWSYEDNGKLTIKGTGAMANYIDYHSFPWYAKKSAITSVVIGDGVTTISDLAFYECNNLTSVSIPASVTSIGVGAFYCGLDGADNLTVNIADGSSLTTICEQAFRQAKLTSITLPASVTSIGSMAFYDCTSLASVSIPNSVTTIGYSAFEGCSTLATIEIPASVTSIGGTAFRGCHDHATITLNSNPYIDYDAFPNNATVTMNLTANTVGDAKWTTFYNENYSFEANGETEVFKVALSSTGELTMNKVTNRIVDAGTAVVLKSTGDNNPVMTLTSSPSGDEQSNSLIGVSASAGVETDGTFYVLNYTADNGVGFYKLGAGNKVGVGKAYLIYDGVLAREFFCFDDAAGISLIPANSPEGEGSVYDLQGRRVSQPTKGLYIVNGKKVIK